MIFVELVSARIGGREKRGSFRPLRLGSLRVSRFTYPSGEGAKRETIEVAEDNRGRDLIKTAIRLYYRITLQLRITNTRGNKLQRLA